MHVIPKDVNIPPNLMPLYSLVHESNGSIEGVLDKACQIFPQVTKSDLLGKRRTQSISAARQAVMFVLTNCYGMTLTDAGEMLGGRDHTTVLYGVNKLRKAISDSRVDITHFTRGPGELIENEEREARAFQRIPVIVDCRPHFYQLGLVEVFASASWAISYFRKLNHLYGPNGVREGPAIDIVSRRRMSAPLAVGVYYHQRVEDAAFKSGQEVPLLRTEHSLTLEEALRIN
jgi:hypothetical protein